VLFPHPQTGKIALYVPDSSTGIQSADRQLISTAQSLIDSLILQVGIYEHEWQQGDLVITDNLQAMHRSMGGYGDNPRLLYRCQARIPMNTPC
jgi:tRNA(adenine34) deaminase